MESGFTSVWNRVTGACPAEDEQTKLRRWIRDEAQSIRAYEALLRAALPKPANTMLRQVLSGKKRRLKRLQTMYFLRTGDTFAVSLPQEGKPLSFLHGLRDQYAVELTQAECYRQAASAGGDLSEVCALLAEENRNTAAGLRSLAERLL